MKKIFTVLLLAMLPVIANAWNFTGHVVVAQIAYNNLTPEVKSKADKLAAIIFNALASQEQKRLDRQYPNASTFAKIAPMPDIWRQCKLNTLFTQFNANIPENLLPFSNASTASWHFMDAAYPQTSHCKTIQPTNVVWALNTIEPDLATSHHENTQALLMVLTEHFVGDIHQPLHAITNVTHGCSGDSGGNQFCLRKNQAGRCTINLHSLWDSAVGFLKPHQNIAKTAYMLQISYPKSQVSELLKDNNLADWIKEDEKFAPFIYSTPENTDPSPAYYKEGQAIAKKQLVLAGYRLAATLNQALK